MARLSTIARAALLGVALAAAGCHDAAVDALTQLKAEACACHDAACALRVRAGLERHAAELARSDQPTRARQTAEDLVACLARAEREAAEAAADAARDAGADAAAPAPGAAPDAADAIDAPAAPQ